MKYVFTIIMTAGFSWIAQSQIDTICIPTAKFDILAKKALTNVALVRDTARLSKKVDDLNLVIRSYAKERANDSIIKTGMKIQVDALKMDLVTCQNESQRMAKRIRIWRNFTIGFAGFAVFNGVCAYIFSR